RGLPASRECDLKGDRLAGTPRMGVVIVGRRPAKVQESHDPGRVEFTWSPWVATHGEKNSTPSGL
ncbi:hypothetical protein, partial [Ferruginibacter sp. HRS2-29]|uniref:hypothetical protein n=1 Tax=Ferruginibacter sp. HRS2-29 TaxID=2487334 RepID=UPI0020CE8F81